MIADEDEDSGRIEDEEEDDSLQKMIDEMRRV
jgi:hypothetical protein